MTLFTIESSFGEEVRVDVMGKQLPASVQHGARGKILQVHPKDNVLVALAGLKNGEEIGASGKTFVLLSDVPAKHKFVTTNLGAGDPIIMYGISIGRAVEPLRQGTLITTKNVRHFAAEVEGKSGPYEWTAPDVSRWRQRTFLG